MEDKLIDILKKYVDRTYDEISTKQGEDDDERGI